jgi:hypothetical protein
MGLPLTPNSNRIHDHAPLKALPNMSYLACLHCLALLLLTGFLFISSAQADNYFVDSVKVQSNLEGGIFSEDGYSATFAAECTIIDFTPQSPPAQIAPGSGDPGHSTSIGDVMHVPTCWMDCSSGQCGAVWDWNFPSLQDLGVWEISCNALTVDPAYCTGTCIPTCDPSAPASWGIPYTIDITVWNNPPTASVSHSPTPAWNQTVTLDANSSDPDGGSVSRTWSITSRPPGSATNLSSTSSETPSLNFHSENDIGNWAFQLHVDDNEGERRTFTHSFDIPNVPPNINISGATDIDALENIDIAVTPTTDVDGGNLDIVWELQQSPPTSALAPQSNFCATNTAYCSGSDSVIIIPTTEDDIGTWQFRATATDNEGDDDTAQITTEVNNLPPDIHLEGATEIAIGDTIQVETTILDDPDGGQLEFQWDIIQAPRDSSVFVQENYHSGTGAAGAYLSIPAGYDEAGTWIFRLTATDNEGESIDDEYTVLVDGPVGAAITGPDIIGSLSFPLTLDGSDSLDTDSPCLGTAHRCHDTLDGRPVTVSAGVVSYAWSLVDIPYELWGVYPLGSVDDVFGVSASGSTMTLDFGDLETGDWIFQLQVVDAEGNEDYIEWMVTVVDETGPPFAIISPPARYNVDVSGFLASDITLSGAQSFDLDNVLIGDPLVPGVGITDYAWNTLTAPTGCTPPALPSGPASDTFNLYNAGDLVDSGCHGHWEIGLTVTDDDSTPKTADAQTSIIIGNCPGLLCIDYPTTLDPQYVEFTEDTDILIYYHMDSALYDEAVFASGLFAYLEIFHQDDLATPVYTSTDPNLLATNKGGILVFQWNGYTDSYQRPEPGLYTIRITLLDYTLGATAFAAVEPEAIWIQVADAFIAPGSDKYIDFDELESGADSVDFSYEIFGGAVPDEIRWRVRDASSTVVFESVAASSLTGSMAWDAQVGGATLATGEYSVEVEAYQLGASLGVSDPHSFTIYRLDLVPASGAVGATPPGLYVYANTDDDNWNNTSDLTESWAGETDLEPVNIVLEPEIPGVVTIDISTGPAPYRLWDSAAKGTQTALPASYSLPGDTVPAMLFVEGEIPETTDMSIEVQTADGETLGPKTIALTVVEVQVMQDTSNDHAIGAGDIALYHSEVARWDNAYDAALAVRNNADPDNFVDRDPRRIYVRVRDPSANADPAAAESITVQLGTLSAALAADDDLHDITLTENAVNSGEFTSPSQILTSHDIQVANDPNADDELHAHDGTAGTVADDAARDRTHQAEIDGAVRLQYQPTGAASATTWDVPLCQRAPETRRRAPLVIYVFNEPYEDVGLDGVAGTADAGEGDGAFSFTDTNINGTHDAGEPSEPYIDLSHGGVAPPASGAAVGVANGRGPVMTNAQVAEHMQRANIAWAQGCISTELNGAIQVVDAPQSGGVDILLDGNVNLPADATSIYGAYSATMGTDRTYIFFGAPMAGANAIAFPPNNPMIAHGEHSFVLLAPNLNIHYRTMAHELGHILTNRPDNLEPLPIFFPQSTPVHAGYNDSNVSMRRRISQATETNARTVRPAGNTGAVGNSVLTTP